MMELSNRRHQFPPVVIQHAVWLYLRFTLSYRDVEDLLAERGLDISYETVRSWVLKFGPVIARRLRRRRPRPSNRWHLDEMVVRALSRTAAPITGRRATRPARCCPGDEDLRHAHGACLGPSQEWIRGAWCNGRACPLNAERAARGRRSQDRYRAR